MSSITEPDTESSTPLLKEALQYPPASRNVTEVFFRDEYESLSDFDVKEKENTGKDFVASYTDWKLDEEAEEFRKQNPEAYELLVGKFNRWFMRHKGVFLYNFVNTYGIHDVDYAGFKRCLRDIEVPATDFELHLICLLFDTKNNKAVDLKDFEINMVARMQRRKDEEELPIESQLTFQDKYVTIHLICEMMALVTRFVGHLKILVKSDLHVFSLLDVINSQLPLNSQNIHFYFTKEDAELHVYPLPMEATLESLGIPNGPQKSPPKFTLFYNYLPIRALDPLLKYLPHESVKSASNLCEEETQVKKPQWGKKKKKPPQKFKKVIITEDKRSNLFPG